MTFEEMLDAVRKLEAEEIRHDRSDYLEIVIPMPEAQKAAILLESFFGPPFKPPGQNPSKLASERSDRYGGVLKNQTLYWIETDARASCAMLWPWNDKNRVTVKIAQGRLGDGRK
jgi:hypothetical protein